MADFESKYSGEQVENLLDMVANGEAGGGGGGGIAVEIDPIFSASPAASITEADKQAWSGKQDAISDLATIRSNASKGATAVQPASLASVATSGSYNDLSNKPTIPSAVTESTVSGWGFTKNTGTYSKPSGGIPKTDLASAVQTSLGKADTALQSYTEQYKGTVTGVKINGTTKNPVNGIVDLGTIEGGGGGGLPYYIVQSFDVVTITNGYSGEVEVDSQEMAHLFRAIHEGKVVLIPYELGEDLGYYIASGYAEDLIYLSLVVSGNIIDVEIGVEYATATLSYTQKRNVEYENQEIGSPNIARAEGFYSPTTDLKYALPYTDAESDINPDYVLGVASRINILDGAEHSHENLQPYNISRIDMDGGTYSFDFSGVPTFEELQTEGYRIPEWTLLLYGSPSTIVLPDTVYWANGEAPTFEKGQIYELRFMAFDDGIQRLQILGTWAKYTR